MVVDRQGPGPDPQPEETGKISEVIAEGAYYGMQDLRPGLLGYVMDGRISEEVALESASSPHDFKLMLEARGQRASGIEQVMGNGDGTSVPGMFVLGCRRPPRLFDSVAGACVPSRFCRLSAEFCRYEGQAQQQPDRPGRARRDPAWCRRLFPAGQRRGRGRAQRARRPRRRPATAAQPEHRRRAPHCRPMPAARERPSAAPPGSVPVPPLPEPAQPPPTTPARPSSCWSCAAGGIDDALVARSVVRKLQGCRRRRGLRHPRQAGLPATPAITLGVDVNRVPALVVVRPRKLSGGDPAGHASSYGFQSPAAIVQAVRRRLLQRHRPRPTTRN